MLDRINQSIAGKDKLCILEDNVYVGVLASQEKVRKHKYKQCGKPFVPDKSFKVSVQKSIIKLSIGNDVDENDLGAALYLVTSESN